MTPLFILIRDHLRRNWKSLTLLSPEFAFLAPFIMLETSDTSFLGKYYPSLLYAYFAILASLIGMGSDLNFLRLSRTLPFRKSTLANLVWSMAVVAPPVFSFVIVLLAGCLAFCLGQAPSLPIAWSLLFLLLATLFSGVLTFVRALTANLDGPLMALQQMQKGSALSASYMNREIFALSAGYLILYFYPAPTRWSDLTPLHLAGMGLAAFLTWMSYRLRYRLLQSDPPRHAIAQLAPKIEYLLKSKEIARPPKFEDLLKSKGISPLDYDPVTAALVHLSKSKEVAPRRCGSALATVAQDLKSIVRGSLVTLLLGIGLLHLLLFCLTWSGWAPDLHESFTSGITLVAFFLAATEVSTQFGRLSLLKAVRALPLTGNQCVWLVLSYPYAVTLAVVPCLTAYLWLTDYGQPLILLLGGILLSAGLCPFAMFLAARFGRLSLCIITFGSIFVGELVYILILPRFGVYLTPQSPPILCAGVLLLAVLGGIGFFGLRRLIENKSTACKRKPSPQQFGQGAGR